MAGLPSGNGKHQNEDIDSKIADFMADIDEIVSGKKPTHSNSEQSDWQECFDESAQAVYYWNCKTNACSWQPPSLPKSDQLTEMDEGKTNKRPQTTTDDNATKKKKKPALIAEYTSSESENSEEEENTVDDIDELLNEVMDKKEKIDLYPLFEADCRAAIARLIDLGDNSIDICTLRIQLETRLEDCLAGHLSKPYAVSKLEEALIKIDELEKLHLTSVSSSNVIELVKPSITISDIALLRSLPPPPPPPPLSPLPPVNEDDQTLQLFYAQLNGTQSSTDEIEKSSMETKSEFHHHHHHYHHKDKKTKPAKTLPTDLIQKWAHARQELHGDIADLDES